jgi:hypothetical protein
VTYRRSNSRRYGMSSDCCDLFITQYQTCIRTRLKSFWIPALSFCCCLYFLRKTTQWCSMQLSSTKFQRNCQKESDNIHAVVADGRSNSNSDRRGCDEASSYPSAKNQLKCLERPAGVKRAAEAQRKEHGYWCTRDIKTWLLLSISLKRRSIFFNYLF